MSKNSKRKQKSRKFRSASNVPALRNTPRNPTSGLSKVVTQTAIAQYSGPIPDAESLAKYGEVIPDAPERILRMAEKQAEHRQFIEKRVIGSDLNRAYLGVACAFVISMTVILTGFYLVLHGQSIPGTIFTGLGLASLAGTFIYGTQSRKEERQRRDEKNLALVSRN